MSFKVRLSNIGKIEKAELRIAPFTVFAGPNNTGKSFASKLLYSLFDALNQNPAEAYVSSRLRSAPRSIQSLLPLKNGHAKEALLARLEREIAKLQELAGEGRDLKDCAARLPQVQEQARSAKEAALLLPDLPVAEAMQVHDVVQVHDAEAFRLAEIKRELTQLSDDIESMDAKAFISRGLTDRIAHNLMRIFQIATVEQVVGNKGNKAEVVVDRLGTLRVEEGRRCSFSVPQDGHLPVPEHSRIIYLESPAYWKLHRPLEHADATPWIGDRQILSGVPGYFHDLVHAIKTEYTGDIPFPDIYKKLTGTDGIGGKLEVSDVGNLSFREGDRTHPISTTATGVANVGMLALLIERKVLDKGTLLFVDEPEAHLHPAWQVLMAKALFELSRQGVTVVMATQSSDIAKWLEVHIGKHPDDKELVAVNRFPPREGDPDADVENTLSKIKEDLLETFSGLYLDAL